MTAKGGRPRKHFADRAATATERMALSRQSRRESLREEKPMEYEIKGDKLVITVNISAKAIKDAKPSATGKTKIVGSSGGFVALPNDLKFSVNVIAK